jgi:hypothetical protein
VSPLFTQKEKNPRLSLLQENAYSRVSWDYRGIIHKKYMAKGIRINPRTYIRALKRLKQQTAFNGGKKEKR